MVEAFRAAMDAAYEENTDLAIETRAPARRTDALERVADSYLAASDGDPTGDESCTMHVHIVHA